MLKRDIFGSTLSLGALLNENIFSDGEADQFLQEMGAQTSRGLGESAACEAHSGTSSFESAFSGLGTSEDLASPAPCESEAFPALFPSLNSTSQQGVEQLSLIPNETACPHQPTGQPAQGTQAEDTRQGLAILGQLFAVLSGSAGPHKPTLPPQATVPQPQQEAAPKFPEAFKSAAPSPQQYTTVPQETQAAGNSAADVKLPNLNAHQQHALQTLMNLGQLGATKEGKKVRRMLSNRESARRSRHRKQAHVVEIEEKAAHLEAENASLKTALSRAADEQMRSVEETTRMYAEIASLRDKIHLLEQAEQSKASQAATANKHGLSHSSTQGAVSTDSCCDSLPAKRARTTDQPPCSTACQNCLALGLAGGSIL